MYVAHTLHYKLYLINTSIIWGRDSCLTTGLYMTLHTLYTPPIHIVYYMPHFLNIVYTFPQARIILLVV